ncbi:hypothetical protein ACTA71_008554 [Dictyostelium dimigraforme]
MNYRNSNDVKSVFQEQILEVILANSKQRDAGLMTILSLMAQNKSNTGTSNWRVDGNKINIIGEIDLTFNCCQRFIKSLFISSIKYSIQLANCYKFNFKTFKRINLRIITCINIVVNNLNEDGNEDLIFSQYTIKISSIIDHFYGKSNPKELSIIISWDETRLFDQFKVTKINYQCSNLQLFNKIQIILTFNS